MELYKKDIHGNFIRIQNDDDVWLDRKEAAKYLGVKKHTLDVWASNKKYNLPFFKVGARCRYKKSDLEKFIKAAK